MTPFAESGVRLAEISISSILAKEFDPSTPPCPSFHTTLVRCGTMEVLHFDPPCSCAANKHLQYIVYTLDIFVIVAETRKQEQTRMQLFVMSVRSAAFLTFSDKLADFRGRGAPLPIGAQPVTMVHI